MSNRTLNTELLRAAYSQGFFPMPDPDGTMGWYRPDPRAIIPLDGFHCSRRLARKIRQARFEVSYNRDFLGVMQACADRPSTWINREFLQVYHQLHKEGSAHSTEIWCEEQLVGGVYGVSLGGAFFAESKFHYQTDGSKLALFYLVERLRTHGFKLLEVQFLTPHLGSLGAIEISDDDYMERLDNALLVDASFA